VHGNNIASSPGGGGGGEEKKKRCSVHAAAAATAAEQIIITIIRHLGGGVINNALVAGFRERERLDKCGQHPMARSSVCQCVHVYRLDLLLSAGDFFI